MSSTRYSGPTDPYRKANGMWAFDVFPNGVRTEFAEYPDEGSVRTDAEVMERRWETDGSYSFVSAIELPLPSR